MELRSPVIITPRLLAGLQVGSAFISIEYQGGHSKDTKGRQLFTVFFDLGDREHEFEVSGFGGLQPALNSAVLFFAACGEGRRFETQTGRSSENSDLFPDWVGQWAEEASDELALYGCELEECQLIFESK